MHFYHLSSVDEIVEYAANELNVRDIHVSRGGAQMCGRHVHVVDGIRELQSPPTVSIVGKFTDEDKRVYAALRKKFARNSREVITTFLGPEFL